MQTVNLRGHHLGAIYDIVAMVKITNTAKNYLEAIDNSTAGMKLIRYYPEQTIETVGVLLKSIFEEKTKIQIVSGLDDICRAGCIQDKDKKNNNAATAEECKDGYVKDDLGILKLFNREIGKIYLAEEIIKKAEELARKTRAPRWGILLIVG